ncbi:MAG: DUF4352 domain-containing protein [Bryobacteraceae bacterium]|nr:DUF4352 domain-containing protein [Bryobacteraceae bacterium]
MGERVQMGTMVYTVLEVQWRPGLNDAGSGRPPKHRYAFVRLSVTNSGGSVAGIPGFTLIGVKDERFMETTEGLEDVPNHLGVLRMIQPAQTEQGVVIFDAPIAAYKFMISDGGEPGSEKFSRVELPVSLE